MGILIEREKKQSSALSKWNSKIYSAKIVTTNENGIHSELIKPLDMLTFFNKEFPTDWKEKESKQNNNNNNNQWSNDRTNFTKTNNNNKYIENAARILTYCCTIAFTDRPLIFRTVKTFLWNKPKNKRHTQFT